MLTPNIYLTRWVFRGYYMAVDTWYYIRCRSLNGHIVNLILFQTCFVKGYGNSKKGSCKKQNLSQLSYTMIRLPPEVNTHLKSSCAYTDRVNSCWMICCNSPVDGVCALSWCFVNLVPFKRIGNISLALVLMLFRLITISTVHSLPYLLFKWDIYYIKLTKWAFHNMWERHWIIFTDV